MKCTWTVEDGLWLIYWTVAAIVTAFSPEAALVAASVALAITA
jgi:hypothetical protein